MTAVESGRSVVMSVGSDRRAMQFNNPAAVVEHVSRVGRGGSPPRDPSNLGAILLKTHSSVAIKACDDGDGAGRGGFCPPGLHHRVITIQY